MASTNTDTPLPGVGSLVTDEYTRVGVITAVDESGPEPVPSVAWLPEAAACMVALTVLRA